MKIGIIGLGAMGTRVAKNIIEDGYDTYVFNRTLSKANELNATLCISPKELVEKTDIIFSFVSNDEASEKIWNDPITGGGQSLTSEKIVLEASTLSEEQSMKFTQQFSNLNFLLSPVVGSRPQVESRQLVFLIGGKEIAYSKVSNLVQSLSKKVIYFKDPIQACQLKLTINALFGIQTIAFAEFYHGLKNAQFSEEKINSILQALPITSPIMQIMLDLFNQKNFEPLFPIDLVIKDFNYAQRFLESHNVESILTKSAKKAFQKAKNMNLGGQNIAGVYNIYNKQN